ncbi:MAG: ABC transporter ATP-binding protein [Candidatus Hydrogenedentes bacterium]|nr:ABC transporter ATP-binding protein [Candidatus Hydrogenedentota bacterium]
MAEQQPEPLVRVRNLSCRFGKKVALDNVSLDMAKGRVFGLMGENGAGKTTLIKHILGALTPKVGEVRVFGVDPTRNPPAVLSQIGYLSEDRDLPKWMRVKEALRYTQAFYPDWDESYAERLREQFRLPADARIRNLSRGEKAKAGLLLALAHRPQLLLLDEPSSGLDAVARRDILAVVVRSVAEEGRTVVFSSHLLDEVERIVDDVAMIHHGKVALNMSMDELKATHHRRVVAFAEPLAAFPEVPCVLHVEGEGCEWAVITHGEADATRAALEQAGARILDETTPSLDSVFVARVVGSQTMQAVA